MSVIYLLKNQHDEFLNKSGEWVLEAEGKSLYRTEHKDEAINLKVEHSVKKPDLRIHLAQATYNDKGKLELKVGQISSEKATDSDAAEQDASEDPARNIEFDAVNPDPPDSDLNGPDNTTPIAEHDETSTANESFVPDASNDDISNEHHDVDNNVENSTDRNKSAEEPIADSEAEKTHQLNDTEISDADLKDLSQYDSNDKLNTLSDSSTNTPETESITGDEGTNAQVTPLELH